MGSVEISSLSPQSVRIKCKSSALVINPLGIKSKISADAVILLSKAPSAGSAKADLNKIEEYRLVVTGAGEYEVSGAKISTISSEGIFCHFITVENSEICVTSTTFLSKKNKEIQRECPIVALYADMDVDSALITELSPRSLILFGDKADSIAKMLGKEAVKSSKAVVSSDKLPEEMQVILLN